MIGDLFVWQAPSCFFENCACFKFFIYFFLFKRASLHKPNPCLLVWAHSEIPVGSSILLLWGLCGCLSCLSAPFSSKNIKLSACHWCVTRRSLLTTSVTKACKIPHRFIFFFFFGHWNTLKKKTHLFFKKTEENTYLDGLIWGVLITFRMQCRSDFQRFLND